MNNRVEGFIKRSGMQVELDIPESLTTLPTELRITLFRTIQEGLSNPQRQFGSQRAKVTLSFEPAEIRLRVENVMPSGSLLPEKAKQRKAEPCFRNLQERIRHFGGRLTFQLDERRTVLEAIFPISRASKRQAVNAVEPRWALATRPGLTQRAG